jgi:hypothetical protein
MKKLQAAANESYLSDYILEYINFVMHLLKSMGGPAFGGSKPAAPAAKSSYFSSLKLE